MFSGFKPSQNLKNNPSTSWCPMTYSFDSYLTLDEGNIQSNGINLTNYSFTTWSGDSYDMYGPVTFTIKLPSSSHPGQLIFKKNGNVVISYYVFWNDPQLEHTFYDSNVCGGNYEIIFDMDIE